MQNRAGQNAAARLNIPNYQQQDLADQDRMRQRIREDREEVSRIVNEFVDRGRFQNADGPEFNEPVLDDHEDNIPNQLLDIGMPNANQPIGINYLDNNILNNNAADRRVGRAGGDPIRVGGAHGANGNNDQGDDNNSEHNSNCTVFSDIPEEDGFCFANQHNIRFQQWNRFEDTQLYMKFIQWEKNSHGLFDYEMGDAKKKFLWTNKNKVVVRDGLNIQFEDTENYDRNKNTTNQQEIFRIEKCGRRYFIEGVKLTDITKDIDEYYQENGEPMLSPNQMEERMFNVVKFLIVGGDQQSQDYQIKKNDLLKMGRIKFKVQQVVNKSHKDHKQRQADRRKKRLDEEKKQFNIEKDEVAKKQKNLGSSLINDAQIQNKKLIFKSKYPKDYDKGPEPSIKSIYTPLMGEKNFINAKRPKHLPRKEWEKQNEAAQNQDNKEIQDCQNIEINSMEFQSRQYSIHSNQRQNRSVNNNQRQQCRQMYDQRMIQKPVRKSLSHCCKYFVDQAKQKNGPNKIILNNNLDPAFKSHDMQVYNDQNNYDLLRNGDQGDLNEVQQSLVPNKRVRDRTDNNREDEVDGQQSNEKFVKPSSLLQQIHEDRNQQIQRNNQRGVEEFKEGDEKRYSVNEYAQRKNNNNLGSQQFSNNSKQIQILNLGGNQIQEKNQSSNSKNQQIRHEKENLDINKAYKFEDDCDFEKKQIAIPYPEADICDMLSDDKGILELDSKISNDLISVVSNSVPQCRVCWMDEDTEENPLLQVCQCRGGVEFIHYDCLKNWLKTKEYRQVTTHYTTIYWRQFQCELCKSFLPYVFRNKGKSYNLISLPELDCDHMILESLTLDVKTAKIIQILHPKLGYFFNFKGFYTIGRGQDCDIKISDISVSRNHCQINFKDGKFWLQDKQSKFGTLVLNQGPTEIAPGSTTGMQIGRTLVVFKTKPVQKKKYNIGQFIDKQIEKDEQWKNDFIKDYKDLEAKQQKPKDNDKKIKMQSFDFRHYMQYLEKDSNKDAILRRQYQDHEIHLVSQQYKNEVDKRDKAYLKNLNGQNNCSQNQQNKSKKDESQNNDDGLIILRSDNAPNIDLKAQIKKECKDNQQIEPSMFQDQNDDNQIQDKPSLMVIKDQQKCKSFQGQMIKSNQIESQKPDQINQSIGGQDKQIESGIKGLEKPGDANKNGNNIVQQLQEDEDKKKLMAAKNEQMYSLHNKIIDILNKDIANEQLYIKPSADFFKAIDEVHRLQRERHIKDQNIMPRQISSVYDPKKKEFEMIQNLEKKQKERDMQTKMKDVAKESRVLITLQQQEEYINNLNINLEKDNDKDCKNDLIQGLKCPEKVDVSQGIINKDRADPKRTQDIIDRLNFRKKQIGVQKMCIELSNKKQMKNSAAGQGQNNANKEDSVIHKNKQPGADKDPQTEKLDQELLEINNEIRYIRKLQARHQELIHQNDIIHKGIEEMWRKQAYNQREAERAELERKERQKKKKVNNEEKKEDDNQIQENQNKS